MSGTARGTFTGYQPIVKVTEGNPEALKYGKMWTFKEYREVSPGEDLVPTFLAIANPKRGSTCLSLGCGTGRSAFLLAMAPPVGASMKVTMLDFVANCLDDDVRQMLTTQPQSLSFIKHDLENTLPVAAEYGYCTDVMEHIPEDKVIRVLTNILRACQHVFFSISNVPDKCGELIGETLHVTVKPYEWWLDLFNKFGCVIHYSASSTDKSACIFYVSAWQSAEEVVKDGVLNVKDETIRDNVANNLVADWPHATPHLPNDMEVMILGGGPSMLQYVDQIKQMRADGVKLVTMNGAYNWALEQGLTPSAQIIVDARAFNARFTKPVVDGCKYLIASQCHPSVFEGLPRDRTVMWHTSTDIIHDILKAHYAPAQLEGGKEGDRNEPWFTIPGGSTVLLRAIPLLRMLGFKKFHLFGCDSCLASAGSALVHHAYKQDENEGAAVVPVVVAGRVFYCHPWMISQGQEFQDLIRMLGDEIELEVYGDGMLAHIMNAAADGEFIVPTKVEEAPVV